MSSPTSSPLGQNSEHTAVSHCQHCHKRRANGVKLLRCSGCRSEVYCSRACQKAAWPAHRELCKFYQEVDPDFADKARLLREFSFKHGPALIVAATYALNIHSDRSRGERDIFAVNVAPRAQPARIEKAYTYISSEILPIVDTVVDSEHLAEVRARLEEVTRVSREDDPKAPPAFMFMLRCPVQGTTSFQFCRVPDLKVLKPGFAWEHMLRDRLNEGIVFRRNEVD